MPVRSPPCRAAAAEVAGATGPPPLEDFDVCIVGAGPNALGVLSALRKEHVGSTRPEPRVCVIDPAGVWMHEWDAGFSALDIEYLRSPAWAHPAWHQEALVDFAKREGRTRELKDVDFLETGIKTDGGYYMNPSTQLFKAFCDSLITTLPHTMLRGAVIDILRLKAPAGEVARKYEVIVTSLKNRKSGVHFSISATDIVFAIGARGSVSVPAPFSNLINDCAGRVVHSSDATRLATMKSQLCKDDTVLVVGGGLSAAQAALLAVGCGARTLLCSRRPLVTRHYDLPLEWMDDRLSHKEGRNRDRMARFFTLPPRERIQALKCMRGGGSIPPEYMEALAAHERAGRLKVIVCGVCAAESDAAGQGVIVRFDNDSTTTASHVVLGTGFETDCLRHPLFKALADRFRLPVEAGFPVLSESLLWGENENITVVGALAAGALGPGALNLVGARQGAGRFATRYYSPGTFYYKKKYEPDEFSLAACSEA